MNELSTQFLAVARKLQQYHRTLHQLGQKAAELADEIEQRRTSLIPADGWPGSNETNRKAARDSVYANDPDLVQAQLDYDVYQNDIDACRLEITCAQLEQKALEQALLAYVSGWPDGELRRMHQFIEELDRHPEETGPETELDLR